MILDFRDKLKAAGKPVELVFVSVDEGDAEVAAFRRVNPQLPAGPRVKEPDLLEPWLESLGLDGNAAFLSQKVQDGSNVLITLF